MYKSPSSSYVYFSEDDEIALTAIYVFKTTRKVYGEMSGTPREFHYHNLKDNLSWNGLDPKMWLNVLDRMLVNWANNLKVKK